MAAPMRAFTKGCSRIAATAISSRSYQLVSGRVAALRTNLTSPIDVRTRSSFDEHRKLLDLFARGEFAAFEALMTTHITNSGLVYAKALKVEALKVEALKVD